MYTKQEASAIRQRFWINFGKYMAPIPSVSGDKQSWVNYRTGIKPLSFKLDATDEMATLAIVIYSMDPAENEMYFNHFNTFKKALEETMEEKWEWELNAVDEAGHAISRIHTKLPKVNVYNENDWPAIITFFKERMIKLDKFWHEYRDIFEMLN